MEAVIAEPPGHRGPASFRAPVIAHRTLAHNAFEPSLAKPINFTFTPGEQVRLSHGGLRETIPSLRRRPRTASGFASYDLYLCGRQEMIRDATLMADERFPGSLVFSEFFY